MNAIAPVRDDAKALVDEIATDLQAALPATISFDRFKATFITAVAHNQEILTCDPQSVKTSLMKAAIDNLMPDNREAAIVPFNTKVKDPETGRDVWVKLAQYMPMVQGIRKRALELGGARIIAEVVYENDHFEAVLGDDPHLEHKPAKLGQPRGEIIGAYAVYKDAEGTILHREVMAKEDIEAARSVSKAKDGPGWRNFYSEFARKTVVRRGAKSIPNIPDRLRTIIERDDDYVDFEQVDTEQRSIDHNPLIDGSRQIENRGAGEVTESGAQREPADKPTPTTPTASAKPSSRDDGGAGATSDQEARPQEQPQERASSGTEDEDRDASGAADQEDSPAPLSRSVFQNYLRTIARYKTAENVKKGVKQFFKDNDVKPGTETERNLFATLRDQLIEAIEGGVPMEKFMASAEEWIAADVKEDAS